MTRKYPIIFVEMIMDGRIFKYWFQFEIANRHWLYETPIFRYVSMKLLSLMNVYIQQTSTLIRVIGFPLFIYEYFPEQKGAASTPPPTSPEPEPPGVDPGVCDICGMYVLPLSLLRPNLFIFAFFYYIISLGALIFVGGTIAYLLHLSFLTLAPTNAYLFFVGLTPRDHQWYRDQILRGKEERNSSTPPIHTFQHLPPSRRVITTRPTKAMPMLQRPPVVLRILLHLPLAIQTTRIWSRTTSVLKTISTILSISKKSSGVDGEGGGEGEEIC